MDKKELIISAATQLYIATHSKGRTSAQMEKYFLECVEVIKKALASIKL